MYYGLRRPSWVMSTFDIWSGDDYGDDYPDDEPINPDDLPDLPDDFLSQFGIKKSN